MKSDPNMVAMEKHICPICGVTHSHNCGILIHKKLREIKPEQAITGLGKCEDCETKIQNGYIALIEADPEKSGVTPATKTMNPNTAHRTGNIVFIKRTAFAELFNVPVTDVHEAAFIDPDVYQYLQNLDAGLRNTTSTPQ